MFSKEKLHHAYCVEGDKVRGITKVKKFLEKDLGLSIVGNPDVLFLEYDVFTIDNARALTELASRKPFLERKVYVIAFNFITTEAQNSLLKLLEEPAEVTNFFLIVSSVVIFLPTLKSRIIVFKIPGASGNRSTIRDEVTDFLKASIKKRFNIAKQFADSVADNEKSKAEVLQFLAEVELRLRCDGSLDSASMNALREIILAKRLIFGRSPSLKMVLEHLALMCP